MADICLSAEGRYVIYGLTLITAALTSGAVHIILISHGKHFSLFNVSFFYLRNVSNCENASDTDGVLIPLWNEKAITS